LDPQFRGFCPRWCDPVTFGLEQGSTQMWGSQWQNNMVYFVTKKPKGARKRPGSHPFKGPPLITKGTPMKYHLPIVHPGDWAFNPWVIGGTFKIQTIAGYDEINLFILPWAIPWFRGSVTTVLNRRFFFTQAFCSNSFNKKEKQSIGCLHLW
jgi:hypothetical protein